MSFTDRRLIGIKRAIVNHIPLQFKQLSLVQKVAGYCYQRWRARNDVPERACHLYFLAVDTDGDVYPCCKVYRSAYHRIGNVSDPGLARSIESYERTCSCDIAKLRKKNASDPNGDERVLNLELSLTCQATCAMCSVQAPDFTGKYDKYTHLTDLVRSQKPDVIQVQGGEVLIQKRSLAWVQEIKSEFPRMRLQVVTNGNVDAAMVPSLCEIFDGFVISFVGFQEETYRAIMGLDLTKTLAFTQALTAQANRRVSLKFLMTALNVHEVALFLRSAAQLRPAKILIAESGIPNYIVAGTHDHFWTKIFSRSSDAVRKTLCALREALQEADTTVLFEAPAAQLLDLDDAFVLSNGLAGRVHTRY